MLEYRVTNDSGQVISAGDKVTDFRGDNAVFVEVTRGTEYNGTAKVLVSWPEAASPDVREYYDRVFGLTVITLCGVTGCPEPSRHSTRDHGKEFRK